uniref:COP9 signalosome complex subunit 8 n=1 Tax=Caligus rogercresseyi TaxID=217165 RepID=C1BP57_CALRO|nr:COP9 signalosome complex subunit 8 [Caligus rogercresseyi]
MKNTEPSPGPEDLSGLKSELEALELNAPNGNPGSVVYTKLLTVYLQQNDLCSAKFLWKRIPEEIKTDNAEIQKVWSVGQALWKREQPEAFKILLNTPWSDNVRELMANVTETIRRRHVDLVASAYSSISISDFSNYVGLAEEQARELALRQDGWKMEGSVILPIRKKSPSVQNTPSEVQIAQLADYISFLEK